MSESINGVSTDRISVMKGKSPRAQRKERKVSAGVAAFALGTGVVGAIGGYAFHEWLDDRNGNSVAREFAQNPDALERVMSGDYPIEAAGKLVVLQVIDTEDRQYGWTDAELAVRVASPDNADKLEAVMTAQSSNVSQKDNQGFPGWQAGEIGVFPAEDVNPNAVTGDDAVFRVAELQGFFTPEEFLPRSVDTPE